MDEFPLIFVQLPAVVERRHSANGFDIFMAKINLYRILTVPLPPVLT
jgi:hypothetical protein